MLSRVIFTLTLTCTSAAAAQDAYHYSDRRGRPLVLLPFGESSFADEATYFPDRDRLDNARAAPEATGAPDFRRNNDDNGNRRFISLGCSGRLVLRFTDNPLVNIPGPDLYVFEIGPVHEQTELAVSADGHEWIPVGEIRGATAEVDIEGHVEENARYYYVQLINRSGSCHGRTPGADIDTVAAIGAGPVERRFQNSVLFDNNEAEPRGDALPILAELSSDLARLDPARAFVVGHTDSVGSYADNLVLSERRAEAVRAYLALRQPSADIRASAYGETRPVTTDPSAEGRALNRRVEVLIVPRQP